MVNSSNIQRERNLQLENLLLRSSVILCAFIPLLNLLVAGVLAYRYKNDKFERVFKLQVEVIIVHIILLGVVFFMKFSDTPKMLQAAFFLANGVVYVLNIYRTHLILEIKSEPYYQKQQNFAE